MWGAGARVTVIGLALTVALGTVACAGDAEPTTLPTLTPAESDSGSPSASPSLSPSKPASKKAVVEAALQAYFSAVNEALDSGSTDRFRKLSTDDCTCLALAESVEKSYGAGRLDGANWSVLSIKVVSVSGRVASAEVQYDTSAYTELDNNGAVTARFPASRFRSAIALRQSGDQWRVSDVDILSRSVRDA